MYYHYLLYYSSQQKKAAAKKAQKDQDNEIYNCMLNSKSSLHPPSPKSPHSSGISILLDLLREKLAEREKAYEILLQKFNNSEASKSRKQLQFSDSGSKCISYPIHRVFLYVILGTLIINNFG